jgi:hypothetical protein
MPKPCALMRWSQTCWQHMAPPVEQNPAQDRLHVSRAPRPDLGCWSRVPRRRRLPFDTAVRRSGNEQRHSRRAQSGLETRGRDPRAPWSGLLDSYQRERLGHVGEMIELALRMGNIMGPKSRIRGALTQFGFRCLNVWPPARSYFAEMKYKPKPRFTDGFLVPDGARARHTLVGRLIPQPVAVGDDGATLPLDAALGDGFSLLAFTEDPARFAAETAQLIWQQLGVRRILITTSGARSTSAVTVLRVPREQLVGAQQSRQGSRPAVTTRPLCRSGFSAG